MSTLINGKSALLLAVLSLIFISASQNLNAQNNTNNSKTMIATNWISWNGVFKPGVDSVTRQAFLENLKGQIAGASKTPVNGQIPQKGLVCKHLTNHTKKAEVFNVKEIRTQVCPDNDCNKFLIFADVELNFNYGIADSVPIPVVKPPKPPKLEAKLLKVLDSFSQNESLINVHSYHPAKAPEGISFATPVFIGRLRFGIVELDHLHQFCYLNRLNVLNAPRPKGILIVSKRNQYISN